MQQMHDELHALLVWQLPDFWRQLREKLEDVRGHGGGLRFWEFGQGAHGEDGGEETVVALIIAEAGYEHLVGSGLAASFPAGHGVLDKKWSKI